MLCNVLINNNNIRSCEEGNKSKKCSLRDHLLFPLCNQGLILKSCTSTCTKLPPSNEGSDASWRGVAFRVHKCIYRSKDAEGCNQFTSDTHIVLCKARRMAFQVNETQHYFLISNLLF